MVTLKQLYNITLNASEDEIEPFVDPLAQALDRFKVNTPLRICHFLAQVLFESGEFRYQEEIASGDDYEGREDLGNTEPGDGCRFKGRGLIQVTGRANYAQLSRDIGVDYLGDPARLAQIPDCIHSAFWYWNSRQLSLLADQDDFDQITLKINGGYNGYNDRLGYLARAKQVFGL